MRYAVGDCYLGKILVAVDGDEVCAVLLGDSEGGLVEELREKFGGVSLVGDVDGVGDVLGEVVGLVDSGGEVSELGVGLGVKGTAFQERVWEALREIPAGETRTYSEVADAIGSPKSVRAVATACGANKLAVVIPCHRVVAKNGSLSGYRWGVERKRALLERERVVKSTGVGQ